MPKCISQEYTVNTSKHFSTQIGYSNYPRLFNLAARLRGLLLGPIPDTIQTQGLSGGVGMFLCVTS